MKKIEQIINETISDFMINESTSLLDIGDSFVNKNDKSYTATDIELVANNKNMKIDVVIPGDYSELEFLAVSLKPFLTAFFLMDNETFDYRYSHTYNANNDKISRKNPFKNELNML